LAIARLPAPPPRPARPLGHIGDNVPPDTPQVPGPWCATDKGCPTAPQGTWTHQAPSTTGPASSERTLLAIGVRSCWWAVELPTPIRWRVGGQNSYRLRVPISPSISCSALLINGTVGAGKTSVAEMVGDLLTEAGVPNAVIDLDWLRRSWPSPDGDRFNVAMALRNLSSVARNYRDAGAVRIVLGGVIETKVERDRHQDTLGVPSRCAGYAWTCRW